MTAPAELLTAEHPLYQEVVTLLYEYPDCVFKGFRLEDGKSVKTDNLGLETEEKNRILLTMVYYSKKASETEVTITPGWNGQGPRERKITFSRHHEATLTIKKDAFPGPGGMREQADVDQSVPGMLPLFDNPDRPKSRSLDPDEESEFLTLLRRSVVLNPRTGFTPAEPLDCENGAFIPPYLRDYLAGHALDPTAEAAQRELLRSAGLRFLRGEQSVRGDRNPLVQLLSTTAIRNTITSAQRLHHGVKGPALPVFLGPSDIDSVPEIGLWVTGDNVNLTHKIPYEPLPLHPKLWVLRRRILRPRPVGQSDDSARADTASVMID